MLVLVELIDDFVQTIHGESTCRVSSLVWCCVGSKGMSYGRLFSSNIDGSVSEWDLFDLKQKVILFYVVYFHILTSLALILMSILLSYSIMRIVT